MKIISKFKDYYDGATGIYDPVPHYIRKTEDEFVRYLPKEKAGALKEAIDLLDSMPSYRTNRSGIVFFCGRCYPFYEEIICQDYRNIVYPIKKRCFYDIQKLIGQLEENIKLCHPNGRREKAEVLKTLRETKIGRTTLMGNNLSIATWDTFVPTGKKIHQKPFVEFSTPVFVLEKARPYSREHLTINPQLKSYDFASAVSPYEAYQEISMFLGNELSSQMDPNIQRTDNDIRDSKGFDDWSFRRHKEESKKYPRKK